MHSFFPSEKSAAPENTSGKKHYEVWEGNNNFFCNGKIFAGPNHRFVLLTFFLINIPSLLEEALVLRHYLGTEHSYYFWAFFGAHILTNIFLVVAAISDPGIIYKNNGSFFADKEHL